MALKSTIDLTCNDYISNFEFDVFTRQVYPPIVLGLCAQLLVLQVIPTMDNASSQLANISGNASGLCGIPHLR